jgi:hypothetical protein
MKPTRVAAAHLLAGLGIATAVTVAPLAFAHTAHRDAIASANPIAVHTVGLQHIWHLPWHPTTTKPAQTAPAQAAHARPQAPSTTVMRPAQALRDPYAPMPRPTGIPATSVPVAPANPPQQPAF